MQYNDNPRKNLSSNTVKIPPSSKCSFIWSYALELSRTGTTGRIKSKNLSKAWDNIERKYGFGSLKMGAIREKEE